VTGEGLRRAITALPRSSSERRREEPVWSGSHARVPTGGAAGPEDREFEGVEPPVGALDITLYRDDLQMIAHQPVVSGTTCPPASTTRSRSRTTSLHGAHRSRRPRRADRSRTPKAIQLAVSSTGTSRDPIRADFVGKRAHLAPRSDHGPRERGRRWTACRLGDPRMTEPARTYSARDLSSERSSPSSTRRAPSARFLDRPIPKCPRSASDRRHLFFEASTRTRLLVRAAEKRSARYSQFPDVGSSVSKGESLKDTRGTSKRWGSISWYPPQARRAALPRAEPDSRRESTRGTEPRAPHQGLLDLFTIRERRGKMRAQGRDLGTSAQPRARSNIGGSPSSRQASPWPAPTMIPLEVERSRHGGAERGEATRGRRRDILRIQLEASAAALFLLREYRASTE